MLPYIAGPRCSRHASETPSLLASSSSSSKRQARRVQAQGLQSAAAPRILRSAASLQPRPQKRAPLLRSDPLICHRLEAWLPLLRPRPGYGQRHRPPSLCTAKRGAIAIRIRRRSDPPVLVKRIFLVEFCTKKRPSLKVRQHTKHAQVLPSLPRRIILLHLLDQSIRQSVTFTPAVHSAKGHQSTGGCVVLIRGWAAKRNILLRERLERLQDASAHAVACKGQGRVSRVWA